MHHNRYSYSTHYGLYLTQADYSYPYFINPLQYMLDNRKTDGLPLPMVIGYLQNAIREILYIFLNFPFTRLLYPHYRRKFMRLLPLVDFLCSHGAELRNFNARLRLLKDGVPGKRMTFIASLFGDFYEEFSTCHPGLEENLHVRIKPPCSSFKFDELALSEPDTKYLEPLKRLQKYGKEILSDYILGFYLHGSFATKDYVKNWSDIDTLMILKKETLKNVDRLIAFQRAVYKGNGYLYLMDPFHSHGFFAISEYDLDYYPETYFPLEVFRFSKSFLGEDSKLKFRIRNAYLEKMELLWRDVVHYTRRMLLKTNSQKRLMNYSIRMLLHRIYVFPVFYLQARGIQCYKKFSFDMAKPFFSEKEWRPVEIANKVYKSWEVKYGYRFIPSSFFSFSPLTADIFLKIIYNFKKNLYKKYKIDYWNLLLESNQLFETAWERLPKQKTF